MNKYLILSVKSGLSDASGSTYKEPQDSTSNYSHTDMFAASKETLINPKEISTLKSTYEETTF